MPNGHMHHAVATEHGSKSRRRNRPHHIRPAVLDQPLLLGQTAIRRLDQQGALSGGYSFLHLLEPANGIASASRQTEKLRNPLFQRLACKLRKTGRRSNPPTGSTGKDIGLHSLFYHIPPRTQPHAATGQGCSDIEDERFGRHRLRRGDETQHRLPLLAFARHETPAQRADFGRRVFVSNIGAEILISQRLPLPRTSGRALP